MRLIGYCRVSTDLQEREGVSLDAQVDQIEKWTEISKTPDGQSYELVSMYRESISGKKLNRPMLNEAREMCKNGLADGIIVIKLDRLTRSLRDITDLIEHDFKKYDLISIGERLDTESAVGRLMLNMIVMVSQWEREAIAERTKFALQHKKSKGQKLGGYVPYGYESQEIINDGKSTKILQVNEQELKMVGLIMEWWNSDNYSLNKIAKELFKREYYTRLGTKFQSQQIKRIIDYQNEKHPEQKKDIKGGVQWGSEKRATSY